MFLGLPSDCHKQRTASARVSVGETIVIIIVMTRTVGLTPRTVFTGISVNSKSVRN